MKKTVFSAILGLASLAMITSCSLDEVNNSSVTASAYITGEDQYEELVTAAYMYLRPLYNGVSTNMMWYGTDIYSRFGEVNDSQVGIDDYSNISVSDGSVSTFWDCNYDIITKCNVALTRGESVNVSSATLTARTAELKVLRALAYFNLVETFGGVPIVTREVTTPDFGYVRASEQDVYEQIVTDLNDAITSGGLQSALPSSSFGRVDLACAYHLLGKVLLTRSYKTYASSSDLTSAISYLEKVESLHPLASDWGVLFDQRGADPNGGAYDNTNSEVILSVRFNGTSASNSLIGSSLYQHFKSNSLQFWAGFATRGAPYYRHDGSYRAGDDFFTLYEDDDYRASEAYIMRHLAASEAGSYDGVSFEAGDEVIYFPKYAISDAEVAAYKAAHPTVYQVIQPTQYSTLFAAGNNTTLNPFIYKFFDTTVSEYTGSVNEGSNGMGTRDEYIFRTAETKLLLAEAYLKNGQADKATAQVNAVRRRANATALSSVTLDDILDESARELFGESNRWQDLKRCGKLFERAFAHNPFVRRHWGSASAIPSDYLLRPIPQKEIDRTNGSITQNPGYAGA